MIGFMDLVVVLGFLQVLLSSDGSKLSKLADVCMDWLQRVASVLGK